MNWDVLSRIAAANKPTINLIPKFPAVQRDLAIVVPTQLAYEEMEKTVQTLKLNKLQGMKLFDIFESEKFGTGKNQWR